MDNLSLLSFLTICCCAFAIIKINDLDVPSQLQHGKRDYVILDCKFELQDNDDKTGLVIKWFFEKKNLIYQWFPGKEPQAIGILKDRTDLSYSVSDDPNTKHRALKITNITTDLTGEYTCKVSSFFNEASLAKEMVIFEPPKDFTFHHIENSSLFLCSAYDMFPKPTMNVYAYGTNLTKIDDDSYEEEVIESTEDEDVVEKLNGLYNVTSSFQYEPSEISEPTEFICELTIPNTNFRQLLAKTIYPEGEGTTTTTEYEYYETTTISIVADNSGIARSPSIMLLTIFTLMQALRNL